MPVSLSLFLSLTWYLFGGGGGRSTSKGQAFEALSADLVWDIYTKEKGGEGRGGGAAVHVHGVCVSPGEAAGKECTLEPDVCLWTRGKMCIPAPASTGGGRQNPAVLRHPLHGNGRADHRW